MPKYSGEDEEIALFRYSLIVPALNGTYAEKSVNDYFIKLATKEHMLPLGNRRYFDSNTFKNWYYMYQRFGFDGLKPGRRSDFGKSKKIPITVLETIEEIKKQKKNITRREIYEELCNIGELRKCEVAESTFYRFLRLNNLGLETEQSECKAFEAARPNDIWQADTSNVMRIKVNNKSETVYLVHILDDASRLIVGQALTFNDNAIFFQETLKKAIKIYGVPKVLYCDNGSPYANSQLELICANMGIHLIHAKPYSPRRKTGKSKDALEQLKIDFSTL